METNAFELEFTNLIDVDSFTAFVTVKLPTVTIQYLQTDHLHHKFLVQYKYPLDLVTIGVWLTIQAHKLYPQQHTDYEYF